MILRVNRRHHSRDAYLGLLSEAGIAANACVYSRDGIILDAAADVRSLPGFAEGWISVQDEAAQLAADLLTWRRASACSTLAVHPAARPAISSKPNPKLAGVVAVDPKPNAWCGCARTSNA